MRRDALLVRGFAKILASPPEKTIEIFLRIILPFWFRYLSEHVYIIGLQLK